MYYFPFVAVLCLLFLSHATAALDKTRPDQERSAFDVPQMTPPRKDVRPFEYVNVGPKIPHYVPGEQWGTQGPPITMMQQPLPAEESLKHYVVPEGFRMELVAAEPDLGGKPVAMNWDERGRLWVCETVDYPNELRPAGKGRDRIRICEDTDGDGRAETFTVFAEKLSIPTAIALYRGGAIVQDGTRTLYLKDTDGDDRADVRSVLIRGWELGDTHGGVSQIRYGLDNWFWAVQGYNRSAPQFDFDADERPRKELPPFRMGFFRFKLDDSDPPRVVDLEFVRSTNNNTWGLGFSEDGLVFGSTANGNPSVFMPIANRYYERVRGWAPGQLSTIADTHRFHPVTDKVRQVDHHGGYTAAAGHALYTARRYPRTWWNRTALVCGPTGHLVGTFVLTRNGASFASASPCNLVASDDEWSAPIAAEVGPDGNVWFIDWYNYIVQHNPTPHGFNTGKGNAYASDLRDKRHGRIYRVVYEGSRATARIGRDRLSLRDAAPRQLVAALKNDNMLWRLHAQRLIVERAGKDKDIVPALVRQASDQSVDGAGLNASAIHAIWTLHGLRALDDPNLPEAGHAVLKAMRHPSARVRRNAVLAVAPDGDSRRLLLSPEVMKSLGLEFRFRDVIRDDDPLVRLAAFLAIAETCLPLGQPILRGARRCRSGGAAGLGRRRPAVCECASRSGATTRRVCAARRECRLSPARPSRAARRTGVGNGACPRGVHQPGGPIGQHDCRLHGRVDPFDSRCRHRRTHVACPFDAGTACCRGTRKSGTCRINPRSETGPGRSSE